MSKQPLTARTARWSATHPWVAIIAWVVFVALCFVLGNAIGMKSATSADYRVGEVGRAEAIADAGGLTPPATEKILITSVSGALDVSAADAAAREISQRMRTLPDVSQVSGAVRSPHGAAVMVAVTMKGDRRDASNTVQPLLDQTAAVQSAHPGLKIAETGEGSIGNGLNVQRGDDLALSFAITLPVTLVVLLMVFGSVLAAGIPLLLSLSSIFAAMGLYAAGSHLFPDPGVGMQVILMMGMAFGVDYSLFYLKREREERERSGGTISAEAAVTLAAATSGRAILMAGFAVAVSTAALFLANDVIFSSLAVGTIIVVVVAVVASLTVLPALLAKLGARVDRRLPFLRPRRSRSGQGWLWPALLRPAMRRPLVTLLIAGLAMLALAAPALNLRIGVPSDDSYSRSIPELATSDRLASLFPTERAANLIAVRDTSTKPGQVSATLTDLAGRVRKDSLFAGHVTPQIDVSADGHVGTLRLATSFPVSSNEAGEALRRLRTTLVPSTVGQLGGAQYAVGGDLARDVDYLQHQNERLPLVSTFVLLLTLVMMLATFRSVLIALIGTLLNLLSAAAAFGALVAVYQGTWAQGLLGFTSLGFIGTRVPLFLFVILFGLSIDYQIFVVSRIREGVLRGLPTRRAVFDGITSSASVVSSAALVMVSVFVSFMFMNLLELKQIGFGLAVAVLLDAVIVRILILPSILSLLGSASWWPSGAVMRALSAPRVQVADQSTEPFRRVQ